MRTMREHAIQMLNELPEAKLDSLEIEAENNFEYCLRAYLEISRIYKRYKRKI